MDFLSSLLGKSRQDILEVNRRRGIPVYLKPSGEKYGIRVDLPQKDLGKSLHLPAHDDVRGPVHMREHLYVAVLYQKVKALPYVGRLKSKDLAVKPGEP